MGYTLDPGSTSLLKLLIASVEKMPWSEVCKQWADAGYNTVRRVWCGSPLPEEVFEVAASRQVYPRLEGAIHYALTSKGFEVTQERNWADRHDTRRGFKLIDARSDKDSAIGAINVKLFGYTELECLVRLQLLLHMLGVETQVRDW